MNPLFSTDNYSLFFGVVMVFAMLFSIGSFLLERQKLSVDSLSGSGVVFDATNQIHYLSPIFISSILYEQILCQDVNIDLPGFCFKLKEEFQPRDV